MKASNIILIFIFLILISCGNRERLSCDKYIKWVDNSDVLVKTKRFDLYEYRLKLQPYEYFVAKSICDGEKIVEENSSDSNLKSNLITFLFSVYSTDSTTTPLYSGLASDSEISQRNQYCSFEIYRDFLLIHNGDTIECNDAHFIQDYHLRPYNSFVLNFDLGETIDYAENQDFTLIYFDNVWQNGIIKFTYKEDQLKQIPLLKY